MVLEAMKLPHEGSPETASAGAIALHLERRDPVLGGIVRRLGPLVPPRDGGGFPSLVRAIIFQQISGAAGQSILRKIHRAHGRRAFPGAAWFLKTSTGTLARAGISPQKRRYLVDLACQVEDGRLDFAELRRLPDDDVIERLTAILGIGLWTAQMYLIFSLQRPDVLPTGDLGIRKAVGKAWGFKVLPAERTVSRIGRRWMPFRSHASFYLWQSLAAPPPIGGADPSDAPAATRPTVAEGWDAPGPV